jgi:hypothetical protein
MTADALQDADGPHVAKAPLTTSPAAGVGDAKAPFATLSVLKVPLATGVAAGVKR